MASAPTTVRNACELLGYSCKDVNILWISMFELFIVHVYGVCVCDCLCICMGHACAIVYACVWCMRVRLVMCMCMYGVAGSLEDIMAYVGVALLSRCNQFGRLCRKGSQRHNDRPCYGDVQQHSCYGQ